MRSVDLVQHAKRELELVGEPRDVVVEICHIMEHFSAMGHSGASAEMTIDYLEKLLRHQNLTPLSNDESEWDKIPHEMLSAGSPDLWQNNRNSEAFSNDKGLTYWLLSEIERNEDGLEIKNIHVAEVRCQDHHRDRQAFRRSC